MTWPESDAAVGEVRQAARQIADAIRERDQAAADLRARGFTLRAMASHHFDDDMDRTKVTEAFLVAERYSTLVNLAYGPQQATWRPELENLIPNVTQPLDNAAEALDKLLTASQQ